MNMCNLNLAEAWLVSLGPETAIIFFFIGMVFAATKKRKENTGMWCRLCGGPCDLDNCGIEQP